MDGALLQLIEGDKKQVELLFNKIACDNRHTGITKIIEGTQEKRCFPDWSMGYKGLTVKETFILSSYIDLRTCEWNIIENRFENRLNPILIFMKSFYLGDIGLSSEK